MNVICDIIQLIVVVHIPNETDDTLASYFMQHTLIKFCVYYLVVLGHATPFKGAFIAICQALNLNYDIFAKCNHKGLTVEQFHRLLNRSVAVTAEGRGANNIFFPASITAGYARNSTPIDGTHILRSIPAIDRELYFSLDITLNTL